MLGRFRSISICQILNVKRGMSLLSKQVSFNNKTINELAADVRSGLRDNVILPFDNVINISTVLASKQLHRCSLDCFGLAPADELVKLENIKQIIFNVLLRYFQGSQNCDENLHSLVGYEIALSYLSMFVKRFGNTGEDLPLSIVNDIYRNFQHTKNKMLASANAAMREKGSFKSAKLQKASINLSEAVLNMQFTKLYCNCTLPYPINNVKLGIIDVTFVPHSIALAVISESLKMYEDAIVSGLLRKFNNSFGDISKNMLSSIAIEQYLMENCTGISIFLALHRRKRARNSFACLKEMVKEKHHINDISDQFMDKLYDKIDADGTVRKPLNRYCPSVAQLLSPTEYELLLSEYVFKNKDMAITEPLLVVIPVVQVINMVKHTLFQDASSPHYQAIQPFITKSSSLSTAYIPENPLSVSSIEAAKDILSNVKIGEQSTLLNIGANPISTESAVVLGTNESVQVHAQEICNLYDIMTHKSHCPPLVCGVESETSEPRAEYIHITKKVGREKKKHHKAKLTTNLKTAIKNKHNVTNNKMCSNQIKIAMNYPNESIYTDTLLYKDLIGRMIIDIKNVLATR